MAIEAIAFLAAGGCSSSGSSSSGERLRQRIGVGKHGRHLLQPADAGSSNVQTIPMVNGMKLALAEAGGKAGKFTVNYTVLDDSTAAAGKGDPAQTAANARKVAADPNAVYYMGEFNSGASEVSIPILNQGGIPQVFPPYLRGADHESAGQRARRAEQVLPDRRPYLPADRAHRLNPGRR